MVGEQEGGPPEEEEEGRIIASCSQCDVMIQPPSITSCRQQQGLHAQLITLPSSVFSRSPKLVMYSFQLSCTLPHVLYSSPCAPSHLQLLYSSPPISPSHLSRLPPQFCYTITPPATHSLTQSIVHSRLSPSLTHSVSCSFIQQNLTVFVFLVIPSICCC